MSHKTSRSLGRVSLSLAAGALAVTAAAAESRAEQFVLFDVTFSMTKMQADTSTPSKSHFYVRAQMNPERPKDWLAPVDYRNGTVHIRTEVLEKPEGSAVNTWTLCYIPNKGIGPGYGCSGTGSFKEKGVFEKDDSMTSWWQNDAIDWSQGIKGMDLVFKDGTGGSGFAHLRPDPEKYFPTKLRITMIQVSAGAKYDPTKVPNLAASDAGTAVPSDAGTPTDAPRGAGGSSGSSGTGGVSGGGAGGSSAPGPVTGGTSGSGQAGASGTGGATTGAPNSSGGTNGGSSSAGGSQPTPSPAPSNGGGASAPPCCKPEVGGCAIVAARTPPGFTGVLLLGLVALGACRRRRR